ncbi:MAG TPA: efflux transporter outer membrane subunit [Bryobacteraceae bacterium]|nr:efflux transporter outer membrane subunit [Bryobacteraceae bacterium]
MTRRASLALAALFCSACNVAPKYQKPAALPPAVFPESFKELKGDDTWKAANPSDTVIRGKWWEIFGDPQLNALEEKVAITNQNVKQAEAQFLAARAAVDLAHASYYPSITSTPSITETETGNTPGRGIRTASFVLPVAASWVADVWGQIHTQVEGATDSAQVSAANLENARLSYQATLAADYFTLCSLDMQYTLLHETNEAYQKYLQLTIDRFNGGVAAKSDIALAQTQLATTQASETDLGVQRGQFEHAIAVLTGQPPENFSLGACKIAGPPPPIPSTVPSTLLERRPDIASAERNIAVQNANIGLAKVAFYPTIGLSGSAGISANLFQSLFTGPARIWSAGPAVSETIFDFGRRGATMAQARANYDAAVAAYRQTVLAAFQAVEDNLVALRVLTTEAAQTDEAVKAAQQSLDLITERYKAGTNSYLDVIQTQTIALTDERNAVTILQRRMTAAVGLVQALGGGWDYSTLPSYDQLRSAAMADPANTGKVAAPRAEGPRVTPVKAQ